MRYMTMAAKYPWIASKLVKLQGEKRFFNLLHPMRKRGHGGQIRQMSMRITDICNLRCTTCGQWGPQGFLHGKDLKELKQSEVSPERYKFLISDMVAHGHRPVLYLWGGEPTLYKGTPEIVRYAASLGLPTTIATNGSKVKEMAEEFVDSNMFLLQISIDGPDRETHNKIRCASGSDNFGDIEAGIEEVHRLRRERKSELPLIVSLSVVSQANRGRLLDIYNTFKDRVDMSVFYLSWWITPERAEAHEADFKRRFGFTPELHRGWVGSFMPDADYNALAEELDELRKVAAEKGNPPVVIMPDLHGADDLRTYYTDHSSLFGFDQCVSIYSAVEIDSNGDMSPCRDYHDYVVGNVKENTITEIWNNEQYRKFRSSLSKDGLMPVCSRCCGLMGY